MSPEKMAGCRPLLILDQTTSYVVHDVITTCKDFCHVFLMVDYLRIISFQPEVCVCVRSIGWQNKMWDWENMHAESLDIVVHYKRDVQIFVRH